MNDRDHLKALLEATDPALFDDDPAIDPSCMACASYVNVDPHDDDCPWEAARKHMETTK